jgi:hypothetical protein
VNSSSQYTAHCFCGDVEFTLEGNPEVMAYCHCDSCRQWSASPVSGFTLWKPESIQITKGKEHLAGYTGNPLSGDKALVSNRVWCKKCGGHLYTDHPQMKLVDVPSAVIGDFIFRPGFHVHYQESVHPMNDGLPKFKDLPEEAGGTGELLTE